MNICFILHLLATQTSDEKQRAEKILALLTSGDTSDEAQAEFDRLLTPRLHEKFARAQDF
jgi:hypothetical protein